MKKILVVFIAIMLVASSFAGCQSSSSTTQTTTRSSGETGSGVAAPVAGAPTTLPLVEPGSVTITIATNDNHYSVVSNADGLPAYQELERVTGINIEWQLSPGSEINTVMGTRLAAGRDIPDFFYVPQSNPIPYARDGIILELSKLIEDHAPYTKMFLEENPDVRGEMTAPNGNIYHVPSVISGTDTGDPVGWIIRQDWLDKLGLNMPTSIDEMYDVWKAFKTQDPNENGLDDEIPLTVRGIGELGRLGDAWGLHLYWFSNGWTVENGTVKYDWIDPRAKEWVTFANKLLSEGLLDEEFLTQTPADRLGKISRDLVGTVDRFINNLEPFQNAARQGGSENAVYTVAPPPSGPNGYPGHQERYGVTSGAYAFSANTKHPELFVRFVDWLFASPEGNRLFTFGIEGLSYEMVNGVPVYTEWATKNPDGLGLADALRSIGVQPTIPWIRSAQGPFSLQPRATIAHNPVLMDAVNMIEPFLKPSMPKIMMTDEEARELQTIMSDLDTFREETLSQFIFGQKSISEWDNYIAQMKSMQVDRAIEIRQQMYDRYIAAQ